MDVEQKVFELPEHPTKGPQRIVVERPHPDSVWYLVVEENAVIPLVNLLNPTSAAQVLEALETQNGTEAVQGFAAGGWSRIKGGQ